MPLFEVQMIPSQEVKDKEESTLNTWRDNFKKHMREATEAFVTFTKVNGDSRVMHCTTQVPSDMVYERKTDAPAKEPKADLISVWDLEKSAYRSIKIDNVTLARFKIEKPNAV